MHLLREILSIPIVLIFVLLGTLGISMFYSIAYSLNLKHGASVNAMDLWQFTPLHEAASKSRYSVTCLLNADEISLC